MRTVFRARVKPDGPRRSPWTDFLGHMERELVGKDLHVTAMRPMPYQDSFIVVGPADVGQWFIHKDDLDLFESWVEWPKGAELIASTYTAERLLPEIT